MIEERPHGKLLFRVGSRSQSHSPLCANITSLRARCLSVQDEWQADVFVWQEVRLGVAGQNIMAAQAPQPTVRPKAAPGCRRLRVTPWSVKQGGAAVAARQEIPVCTDNARDAQRREIWETQHWAAAEVRTRKQVPVRTIACWPTQRFFCRRFLQKLQMKASKPLCLVWMPTSQEKGLTHSTLCSRRAGGLMLHVKLQQIETSSWRRTTKMVCSLARRSLAPHVLIFWSAIAALGHISVLSVADLIWKYLAMSLPSLFFRLNFFSPMCTVWILPLEYYPSEKGICGKHCSTPHENFQLCMEHLWCELLKSIKVEILGAVPLQTRGQPGCSCAPVFASTASQCPWKTGVLHRWSVLTYTHTFETSAGSCHGDVATIPST